MDIIKNLIEFSKLGTSKIVNIILLVTSTLTPGIIIIFMYKRELFITLDIFKLILLSVSITAPFLLIGFVISYIDFIFELRNSKLNSDSLAFTILCSTCVILHANLLLSWINKYSFSKFVISIFTTSFILFVATLASKLFSILKRKISSQKSNSLKT